MDWLLRTIPFHLEQAGDYRRRLHPRARAGRRSWRRNVAARRHHCPRDQQQRGSATDPVFRWTVERGRDADDAECCPSGSACVARSAALGGSSFCLRSFGKSTLPNPKFIPAQVGILDLQMTKRLARWMAPGTHASSATCSDGYLVDNSGAKLRASAFDLMNVTPRGTSIALDIRPGNHVGRARRHRHFGRWDARVRRVRGRSRSGDSSVGAGLSRWTRGARRVEGSGVPAGPDLTGRDACRPPDCRRRRRYLDMGPEARFSRATDIRKQNREPSGLDSRQPPHHLCVTSDTGPQNLWWRASDGSDAPQRLTSRPNSQNATGISGDSTRVVGHELVAATFDISRLARRIDEISSLFRTPPAERPPVVLQTISGWRADLTLLEPTRSTFDRIRIRPAAVRGRSRRRRHESGMVAQGS